MNDQKISSKAAGLGLVLGAAVLALGTGCHAYVEGPSGSVSVAAPAVAEPDDYVYYPSYGVYYSAHRHQYAYQEGNAWVARPAPRGVSVNVLQASPSVRMDFHDSPAQHHAEVVRKYPKNWGTPAAHAQKDDRNGR